MIRIDPVSIARLGRVVFSVYFAVLLPPGAHAACAQWDVSGQWTLRQTNGFNVILQLQQTGIDLQGKAGDATPVVGQVDYCVFTETCIPSFQGSADGTINGNSFDLNVYWYGGAIGVYTGKVGPQGRIEGSTYDKMNPNSTANWYSHETVKCSPVVAPLVSDRPVNTLGRVKPSTTPGTSVSICESASRARARNSPAAPGLERRCRAYLDTIVTPVAP